MIFRLSENTGNNNPSGLNSSLNNAVPMQCVSEEGYGYLCAVGGLVLMADSRALLAAKIHDLALL